MNKVRYFEKYLDICERFLDAKMHKADAEKELAALNDKGVNEAWKKKALLGEHLTRDSGDSDEEWVPSAICY